MTDENTTDELVLDVPTEETEAKPKKAKKARKAKKAKVEKPSLPEGHVQLGAFMTQYATDNPDYAKRTASWVRDQLRKGQFPENPGVSQNDQKRWIVTDVPHFTQVLTNVIESKVRPDPEPEVEGDPDMEEVI